MIEDLELTEDAVFLVACIDKALDPRRKLHLEMPWTSTTPPPTSLQRTYRIDRGPVIYNLGTLNGNSFVRPSSMLSRPPAGVVPFAHIRQKHRLNPQEEFS